MFSRDSKHLAHRILVDGKYGAVLDGVKGGTPEFDFVDELTISPDGSELAYVAGLQCTVDQGQGYGVLAGAKAVGSRWLVVHGSGRSAEFNAAHEPTWSPDGKALAFVGCKKSEWRVYVGTLSSAPHQEISGLVFSADGKSVAYGCRHGGEVQSCTLTLPYRAVAR